MDSDRIQGSETPESSTSPVVPEHELLRRIGEGAYGEVWLARNKTGVLRAVKVVYRRRFADDRPYEREFKGITKFEPLSRSNEGLVDILQVGRDDAAGFFYYVMELADAAPANETTKRPAAGFEEIGRLPTITRVPDYRPRSLSSDLAGRGRLTFQECVELGLSLSLALGHLHRQGLLHRDVKPSNIIFVGGLPKLADIGLVTELAEARSYVGTEGFIPPDGPNSAQADLYGLGKVLYEISMGKDRQEFPEPMTALVEDPDAPALLELNAIIVKACANDRRERYQSAEEMHADLALLHSGRSVKRKHLLERRVAWMSKVGPVVTAVALLATGGYMVQRRETAEIRRLAGEEARQRARAQGALALADDTVVRLELKRAEEALASDRASLGLAELALVLRQHPTNHVAAERLWSALSQRNFLLPAIPAIAVGTNITATQFGPDGRFLFVGAESGAARIWDAETGQPASPPLNHPTGVVAAAFRDHGSRLLTIARDGVTRFWTVPGGETAAPPLKLDQVVVQAAFSADGRWLSVADTAQHVRVWDAESRLFTSEVVPELESVASIFFTADGERLVTAGKSREGSAWIARVWNGRTGQAWTPPLPHSQRIGSLALSPDGGKLVTGCEDSTAQVWDTRTGARVTSALRHDNWVNAVDFGPEGARVVTGSSDRTVQVWDAGTGQKLGLPLQHASQLQLVQFSPGGRWLMTVTINNTVHLWDVFAGQPVCEPLLLPAQILNAQFSPDPGRLLLTCDDHKVRLFDLRPRQSLSLPLYAPNSVKWGSLSRDGTRAVIADLYNSAWLFDLRATPPQRLPLRHRGPVNSAEFSPDGMRIVTASADLTARVWDAMTGQSVTPPLAHTGSVLFAQFDFSGQRVVTASADHDARVWDAATGQPYGAPLSHNAVVYFAEFSADGSRVATAGGDNSANVWEIGPSTRLLATVHHDGAVKEVHFSKDGTLLVTASEDQTARVWDSHSGAAVSPPLQHNNLVVSAAFNSDASRVVTGSRDATARIWDTRTGAPLSEPLQHEDNVELVRFSPDDRRIVTASRDGTARVWDASTGQPISEALTHRTRVYCAVFSADGRWILSASRDKTARLWEAPPAAQSVPAWVCSLAEAVGGRKLDAQRVLVPVEDGEFWRVRQEAAGDQGAGPYSVWARWFFADRDHRPISPGASMTLADLERHCLQEDSRERTEEWLRLVPDHPLGLIRAARWTAVGEARTNRTARALADWWSLCATTRAPQSAAVWRGRADVLKELGETQAGLAALQRALDLEPEPSDSLTKGRWLDSIGQISAAAEAYEAGIAALTNSPGGSTVWVNRLRLQRVNAWRRLGREHDAMAEIMDLKHFAPRDPNTPTNLLDLTLCFNARPDEDWHSRNDHGNNLADLPLGVRDFQGVSFEVRGIIQLGGGDIPALEPDFPDQMTGIRVARSCRRLHFLHGTGWTAAEGATIGHWVMHFADGKEESVPIVYGKDVRNWQFWPGMPIETGGAAPVWKGNQARWAASSGFGVRLYRTTWENPHPDAPVDTLDFVSAQAGTAPFLLAITAE